MTAVGQLGTRGAVLVASRPARLPLIRSSAWLMSAGVDPAPVHRPAVV